MNLFRLLFLVGCVGCFAAPTGRAQAGSLSPAPYALRIQAERPDATYHVNEPVTFDVALDHAGQPVADGVIDWVLSQDGVPPFERGTAPIKEGRATVSGRLAAPGFLQCKASYKTDGAAVTALGAAAIDPLAIPASMPVPDDFDAFWSAQKAQLARTPINARMTPLAKPPPGIELFEVQADAVGEKPMRGCYGRPDGAKPKSLPAIISLEGAGVYSTRLDPWLTGWVRDGFIALEVNAHGLPSGQPDEFYQALEKGALKDYQLFGRDSRESSYFLPMYLRDLRGVDFLTAQPEWNGRVLIAFGASQGGAQAIFLAAEDPRVTFLAAVVPAMCDHSGMLAARVPGWPRLVPMGGDGKPAPAILQASRYFDGMNFATRIRIPCLFVPAFIDQVAPPTSVYAAYNNIKSDKEIYPAIHSPHRVEPDIWQEVRRRVLLHK